jgi:hypothetical protein
VVPLERWFDNHNLGDVQYACSYPEYIYCRDSSGMFASMVAGSFSLGVVARIEGHMEKIYGQLVSANYFDGLGIGAQLGRTFLPEEDRGPGAHPVIGISNAFWQRRFHSDPGSGADDADLRRPTRWSASRRGFTSTAVNDPFAQFWAPLDAGAIGPAAAVDG